MNEESFSKLSADEAIREFLDMGQTTAFYTSLDSIPDDVICKVSEVFFIVVRKVIDILITGSNGMDRKCWIRRNCFKEEFSLLPLFEEDLFGNDPIWTIG